MFIYTVILDFRFCEDWQQYMEQNPEPDICVTRPLIALKILRNFGHLIANLHFDYNLFYIRSRRSPEFFKFVEYYLAEHCSESLQKISLQGCYVSIHHAIFEDTKKPFINVHSVQTEMCTFRDELPYNRVFPNLKTLKHGRSSYRTIRNTDSKLIRVKFNSLENLWFSQLTFNMQYRLEDDYIEEMFKLNPQIENAVVHYKFKDLTISRDFCKRIKKYCPNVQIVHTSFDDGGQFHIFSFIYFAYHDELHDFKNISDIFDSCPIKISDKYKNALEQLFDLYMELDSVRSVRWVKFENKFVHIDSLKNCSEY